MSVSVVKTCTCMLGFGVICCIAKSEQLFQEQILGSNKPT